MVQYEYNNNNYYYLLCDRIDEFCVCSWVKTANRSKVKRHQCVTGNHVWDHQLLQRIGYTLQRKVVQPMYLKKILACLRHYVCRYDEKTTTAIHPHRGKRFMKRLSRILYIDFDKKTEHEEPYIFVPDLKNDQFKTALYRVQEAIGTYFKVPKPTHCGLIVCRPGTIAQEWHMDSWHNTNACIVPLTPKHEQTQFIVYHPYQSPTDPSIFHKSLPLNWNTCPITQFQNVRVGDILFFNGRTPHRGPANCSKSTRLALFFSWPVSCAAQKDVENNSPSLVVTNKHFRHYMSG